MNVAISSALYSHLIVHLPGLDASALRFAVFNFPPHESQNRFIAKANIIYIPSPERELSCCLVETVRNVYMIVGFISIHLMVEYTLVNNFGDSWRND